MECIDSCPINRKVQSPNFGIRIPSKSKKIETLAYPMTVVLVFVSVIIFSAAIGAFHTERIKTYETVNDIRGSSTIQEITEHYPVTLEELYKAFNIPKDVSTETKLKDLRKVMELEEGDESVSPERIAELIIYIDRNVSEYAIFLGVNIEKVSKITNFNVTEITLRELIEKGPRGIVVKMVRLSENEEESMGEDHEEEPPAVRGITTLKEIKEMINNFNGFLEEFNLPKDIDLSLTLKDVAARYGVSISTMRNYVEKHMK